MFQKATKKQGRLRLALIGSSGSGKTFTALAIARGLVGPTGRIAVLDSEHGSAAKYADQFDFDVASLEQFSPDDYVRAIQQAEAANYDAILIDSLSHAWMGKGGALEQVDEAARRSKGGGGGGNSFAAWRDVTPKHNGMIEAILGAKLHVIATLRAKTEYVLEPNASGKMVPRKVGLAPVQRDGLEYEFDVVGEMDAEHFLAISKTRCVALSGKIIEKPGQALGEGLARWLSDAGPAPAPAPASVDDIPLDPPRPAALQGELLADAFIDRLKLCRERGEAREVIKGANDAKQRLGPAAFERLKVFAAKFMSNLPA